MNMLMQRQQILLGDPTPRMMGRLTMNPFVHLDPSWFLSPYYRWLWMAKPVIVNPTNFKDPRTDDMIVSIAGPMANIFDGLYCVCYHAKLRCSGFIRE